MFWASITPMTLVLILIIVVLLFGTSRLRTIGSDLGEAMRNFRKSMKEGEKEDQPKDAASSGQIEQAPKREGNVYPGEVVNKDKDKQG